MRKARFELGSLVTDAHSGLLAVAGPTAIQDQGATHQCANGDEATNRHLVYWRLLVYWPWPVQLPHDLI